jgi:hypothetical protein
MGKATFWGLRLFAFSQSILLAIVKAIDAIDECINPIDEKINSIGERQSATSAQEAAG